MLKSFFLSLAGLVYPAKCLVCKCDISAQEAQKFICQGCRESIKKNVPPFCRVCGRTLDEKGIIKNLCAPCAKRPMHFDRAFAPCLYEGAAKELIHNLKYKNKEYLGNLLSKIMIDFIKEYNLPIKEADFIIPIPLHASRLREREFNQAQALSTQIAKEFNIPLLTNALIRNRKTRTQTGLHDQERFLNVAASFSVTDNKNIINSTLCLVDDVLTTGATASSASGSLKEAGAKRVFVLTLAN